MQLLLSPVRSQEPRHAFKPASIENEARAKLLSTVPQAVATLCNLPFTSGDFEPVHGTAHVEGQR
jgi:hypothetical protein